MDIIDISAEKRNWRPMDVQLTSPIKFSEIDMLVGFHILIFIFRMVLWNFIIQIIFIHASKILKISKINSFYRPSKNIEVHG